VWFVRRRGAQWIAPGGTSVHQAPLAELIFKLDIGPQRWLSNERPTPGPELPREETGRLTRVMVETAAGDLAGCEFTAYRMGFYESPYPPTEAARRLGVG
jgi:hypothetical protein